MMDAIVWPDHRHDRAAPAKLERARGELDRAARHAARHAARRADLKSGQSVRAGLDPVIGIVELELRQRRAAQNAERLG